MKYVSSADLRGRYYGPAPHGAGGLKSDYAAQYKESDPVPPRTGRVG